MDILLPRWLNAIRTLSQTARRCLATPVARLKRVVNRRLNSLRLLRLQGQRLFLIKYPAVLCYTYDVFRRFPMPKDFPRSLRVAEQIHRDLMVLLRHTVNDPRVKDFLITEVVVSKDLSSAKVYFAPYANNKACLELQAGLDSCAAYLRKELAKLLRMRVIPSLSFHYDDTVEKSARLEAILSKEKSD